MPEGKQKLTLTVDAEIVEAAHKLGLNISEVTERILRGYTFDPRRLEEGATRDQYSDLLSTMDPLLQKYGCNVMIGLCSLYDSDEDDFPVYYSGRGKLHAEEDLGEDDSGSSQIAEHPIDLTAVQFLKPTQILKNFFSAIESVKTQRREQVEGLVLAKKLIEALNDQELKRATRGQSTGTGKEAGD